MTFMKPIGLLMGLALVVGALGTVQAFESSGNTAAVQVDARQIHLKPAPGGGSVRPILSPQRFAATQRVGPQHVGLVMPHYYVVQGVRSHGHWSYPYLATGPAHVTVMEIERAVNTTTHQALIEQGVALPSVIHHIIRMQGGTTRSSTIPLHTRTRP